jgi:hypothetical protein
MDRSNTAGLCIREEAKLLSWIEFQRQRIFWLFPATVGKSRIAAMAASHLKCFVIPSNHLKKGIGGLYFEE